MTSTGRFRRLVLELGHGATGSDTPRQAAAFARLLGVDLLGVFVEDEALLSAGAFPFAREFNPVTRQWRKLEPERLAAEVRAASDLARRTLAEAARDAGLTERFERLRGDTAAHLAGFCVAGDIVVVSASGHQAHVGRLVWDTAHRSAASVLVLPPDGGQRTGPVAAIVSGADDPAMSVGEAIAGAMEAPFLILPLTHDDPAAVAMMLGDARERLIVMSRDGTADTAAFLARTRGVPVLIVENPN